MKQFDLNIEKILENCENFQEFRKIITNALVEPYLTKPKGIEINLKGSN